ncbi:MAG: amidase [Acidobacteriota bacterium]|jgi:amidase|nr:amidase [Acidobacteriota bacterium]
MDELTQHTAAQLAALIRTRAISPVDVVEAHLRRTERLNPKLNAIVILAPDAIDTARKAEAAVMRGDELGTLHGVPITIKDTIETKGLRTAAGSRLFQSHVPQTDAPSVVLLKAAGAIVLGKTNVPEMAIPYECANSLFGRTNNPYDLDVTSGGSSGGEAAAISACLSPAGLGSDLSGSIRVPAHFCGIAGLTPTPGLVPSAGHIPAVTGPLSEGAVIGPMARAVGDLSLLLSVLANGERAGQPYPEEKLQGSRVASYVGAVPISEDTEQAMKRALSALSDAGLVLVEEKPPALDEATDLWVSLFSAQSAGVIRDIYQGHEEIAGQDVSAVLASITESTSDDQAQTWVKRNELRRELIQWMDATPLIIAPVGSVAAFEHGARRVSVSGQSISVFRAFGYSRVVNVLGLPSVAVPAGRDANGLPIGVQVIGRPFEEETVIRAAAIIEESIGGWKASEVIA